MIELRTREVWFGEVLEARRGASNPDDARDAASWLLQLAHYLEDLPALEALGGDWRAAVAEAAEALRMRALDQN